MQLSEAAVHTRGELRGDDCRFYGVAIDSRRVQPGDLFIAINGASRDGHAYLGDAAQRGAAAALVSADAPIQLPRIAVADTTCALGALGSAWRDKFSLPVLAVTGSNGKTTVTALISAILGQSARKSEACLAPHASFNNHWGVPLTLLRLRAAHRYAVIEMGMNQRGEIARLCELAKPTVALITNAAPAHIGKFASIEQIAAAKGEILHNLDAAGCAVLNADDPFYEYWKNQLRGQRVLSFGSGADADVRVSDIKLTAELTAHGTHGSEFKLHAGGQRVTLRLPLVGRHNAFNAAAATAAALAVGRDLAQCKAGLEAVSSLGQRLRVVAGKNGARVLDDSYNANPASMRAALDALGEYRGTRIAVLGKMGELGVQSDALHRQVGAYAKAQGVTKLLSLGPADDPTAEYSVGFGRGAERFSELEALLTVLQSLLAAEVTVLVKGSRSAAMERVVAAIAAQSQHPSQRQSQAGGGIC